MCCENSFAGTRAQFSQKKNHLQHAFLYKDMVGLCVAQPGQCDLNAPSVLSRPYVILHSYRDQTHAFNRRELRGRGCSPERPTLRYQYLNFLVTIFPFEITLSPRWSQHPDMVVTSPNLRCLQGQRRG